MAQGIGHFAFQAALWVHTREFALRKATETGNSSML